jgi:leucyl-tRNA synthetase
MEKVIRISMPYMYPICPLSLSHSRLFVLADTFARYKKANGYKVFFPIACHYSGNTAIKMADEILKDFKETICFWHQIS